MPYVRTRGNQLLIVHGVRNKDTCAVEQRILFTFYTKHEVEAALGVVSQRNAKDFRALMEEEYPDIRFNWKEIREVLSKNMNSLPVRHEHHDGQSASLFRKSLCDLTRELALADPELSCDAAGVLRENQCELRYISSLIDLRLSRATDPKLKPSHTVPFSLSWFEKMRRKDVPSEVEEAAEGLFNQGHLEQARAVFRLLTESFDCYAEGHNYLGLIALRERKLEEATACFEKTAEMGRKLFPKRIAKSSYWNDHRTRPYMRGLRNLALTLNRLGAYDRALDVCSRLEAECDDDLSVTAFRASIFLNMKRWQEAFENARYLHQLYPTESFIAAFASYELRNYEDTTHHFLHAVLSSPRAARLLVDSEGPRGSTRSPNTASEVKDHNDGVELLESLSAYLQARSSESRRFFLDTLNDPRMTTLLSELHEAEAGWLADRTRQDPKHFQRMTEMRSSEFAREKAIDLCGMLSTPRKRLDKKSVSNSVLH